MRGPVGWIAGGLFGGRAVFNGHGGDCVRTDGCWAAEVCRRDLAAHQVIVTRAIRIQVITMVRGSVSQFRGSLSCVFSSFMPGAGVGRRDALCLP